MSAGQGGISSSRAPSAQVRRWRRLASLAAVAVAFWTGAALAANPVALVEDVEGTPTGLQGTPAAVEPMTYLDADSVIRLAAQDTIVIDYLQSCVHEKIVGGEVTIGQLSSKVVGGKVSRQTVKCDGAQLALANTQAAQGGVMVFRGLTPPKAAKGGVPPADRTLYGLSPVIALPGGGHLVVERLDQPGETMEIDIPAEKLAHRTFYDFAKDGRALAPGGTYRVSAGDRKIVIRIDPKAQPGQAPLAGRLLRL